MTKEEAIKELSVEYLGDSEKIREAKRMAIKALEQEPIYYPPCQDCHTKMNEIVRAYDNVKSCEDAISREKAIMCLTGINLPTDTDKLISLYNERIKALPPVLPKRKQSEWIQKEYWSEGCGMGETYGYYYECSKCGNLTQGEYDKCGLNYCPNCGAKMVEPQEISDTNMKMWEAIYAEEERRTTESENDNY